MNIRVLFIIIIIIIIINMLFYGTIFCIEPRNTCHQKLTNFRYQIACNCSNEIVILFFLLDIILKCALIAFHT